MNSDRPISMRNAGETGHRGSDLLSNMVELLTIAIGQLRASLQQGDASVENLSHAFTVLANGVRAISACAGQCKKGGQELADIQGICTKLTAEVNAAVIAIQFYDRLTQDLTHVCGSLSGLAALISDPSRPYRTSEWTALLAEVHARYTMESGRRLYDRIRKGVPLDEALCPGRRVEPASCRSGGVELF